MSTSSNHGPVNPDAVGADASNAAITLRMIPGGGVEIKARAYLGGDRFGAFRNAIAGARFVPATRTNVAPLDKVPAILRRLHEADFTTSVCDALLAALRADEVQGDALVEAAEGRLERAEAVLAARGLHLFPFQREGVRWLARRTGALLADEMGCVDGEAVVRLNRAGKGFALKLSELHRRFHGGTANGPAWNREIPTMIRSLCDGELRLNRVVDVLDKGVKPVVKMILRSGKVLRLTPDHEVRTPGGFVEAGKLVVGDVVLTNGQVLDKDGYVRIFGVKDHPAHRNRKSKYVLEHQLVMEAHLGRYLRPEERVHHDNEVKNDNRLENLKLTTASSHAEHHGRVGGYRRMNGGVGGNGGRVQFVPKEDAVLSVEPDGEARVYDVVCADPHRNFVANGVVVHNCGKTIQALVAVPEGAPVIVVAPAVAKGVWAREAAAWRPDLKVTVLSGRGSFRWPAKGELLALNYDILPSAEAMAAAGSPLDGTTVIADEAHALKSHKAQRTARFRALGEACRAARGRAWVLTATPLLNRPPELWGVLSAAGIEREVFGTWGGFVAAFDGVKDPKWGGMRWGQPSDAVPSLLARASVRRTRAQVLPELPTKRWTTLEVDVKAGALRACDKLVAKLAKDGVDLEQVEAAVLRDKLQFQDFSEVRAALATAKIPAMLEIVEQHEEQAEPLVVFSAHRAPIDVLAGREGWALITGDTSADERSRIEEAFQRSGDPAYVGTRLRGIAATIQAGGVAITLTRAASILFVDRHWTPALNSQAEDRCCRIGQTRGVVITTLVAPHALDRRLARILTVKTALTTATLALSATPVEEEGVDLDALAVEVTGEIEAQDRRAAERRAAESKDRAVTRRLERRLGSAAGEGSDVEVEEEPRPARGAVEEWVADAVLTLTGMDSDRAAVENGVGWNKADGGVGHAMAHRIESGVGLTAAHWEAARKIVRKYHGQVGREPADVAPTASGFSDGDGE